MTSPLGRNADVQSRGCGDAVIPAPLNADEVITRLLISVMCDGVTFFRLLFGVSVRLDADRRTSVAEVPDFVSILIAERTNFECDWIVDSIIQRGPISRMDFR